MQGRSSTRIRLLALASMFLAAGCDHKPHAPGSQPAHKDHTTMPGAGPETRPPPPVTPADTQPAIRPPAPASLPASTYDSSPPYPVRLFVRSPEDDQPGWLKILALRDAKSTASCSGRFPEKNHIEVQTSNVHQIRLHISHLPLAEKKRIILRIDDQAIELARKNRDYVILERGRTGEWNVAKSLP